MNARPSPRIQWLLQQLEREYGIARAQSSRLVLAYLASAYREGWTAGTRDIRTAGWPIAPLEPDAARVRFLSSYSFDAIKGIETLGVEKVRGVFERATEDATLTVHDIADDLARTFNGQVDGFRLPVIARTETNRSGNAAKYDRYQKAAVVENLQVSTAEDSRVRTFRTSGSDHQAMEGQVRPKGEPFLVPRTRGGTNSNGDRYPPFDPNCRCTLVPVFQDGLSRTLLAPHTAAWHATIDGIAASLERDLRRTWRAAFDRVDHLIRIHGHEALTEARAA